MTQHELAPINWQMGQTLLPDHLVAQEQVLVADFCLRSQTQGLPAYGFCRLEWDNYMLDRGILNIEALRLFTRGQLQLIDYPGNSVILSAPLEFGDTLRPQVFYFVLQPNADIRVPTNGSNNGSNNNDSNNNSSSNNGSSNNGSNTSGSNNNGRNNRYLSNHDAGNLSLNNSGATPVSRRLMSLVMSLNPNLPDEYAQLLATHKIIDQGKLAEFEQSTNQRWQHSERFIPPLLQVGTTPFLRKPVQKLYHMAARFQHLLERNYGQRDLSQIRQYELRASACALNKTLCYLANQLGTESVDGEIQQHPYFLYEALQNLATDLAHASSRWPDKNRQPYHHNDLVGTFRTLLRSLATQLQTPSPTGQSFELVLNDGMYAADLPSSVDSADSLYLVVTGSNAQCFTSAQLPILASKQRLNTVHNYSLSGVRLKPLKNTAIAHLYGEQCQLFQIERGKEHAHIVLHRSIAFLAQQGLKNYSFYLYHNRKSGDDISQQIPG